MRLTAVKSELKSINGRLGAEMKEDKKFKSCIVSEGLIKVIQIKENSE